MVCCFSFLCCLVYWFLVLVSGFVFMLLVGSSALWIVS